MKKHFIIYLVSIAAVAGPFSQSIYIPLLPEVQETFRANQYLVNLTISLFTFVLALMQIIYGPLTDTKGRRKVFLFGLFIFVISGIGASLSISIYMLLTFRVLQAIGMAVGSVVAITVIGDLLEGKNRGRAMGTYQMLLALGSAIGPVVGGFVGQFFGFQGVFWLLSIVGFILFVLIYCFLPETKQKKRYEQNFKFKNYINILMEPKGTSIILLGFIQYYSFYTFLVFLPPILITIYGLTISQNGIVFLSLTLFFVIGSMVGGRLQEFYNPNNFLFGSVSVNGLSIILFTLVASQSLTALIVSLSLFGLSFGLSVPVQTTLLTNEYNDNRGTAIGLYNFSRYIGMAVGPMIGTYFYQIHMLLEFFISGALLIFLLLLSIMLFNYTNRKDVTELHR